MARRDRPVSQRQTWWLIAVAFVALAPLAPFQPNWLPVLAAALIGWRAWITWRGGRLPPRWLLVLLTLAGAVAVFLQYRTLFGRTPGIAMLMLFLSLKLLEMRVARDGLAVVLLGYFLVFAQFLFSQTMLTALLATATVLVTTAALAAAADDRPAPALHLRRAGLMLAQALPFMLVLFILFPRVQGPLWGIPQDSFAAVSGLSDRMAPGTIARLSQSDAIAFRVKFTGETPPQSQLYWRGPVMPAFDGRQWTVTRSLGAILSPPWAAAGPPVDYDITLEAHGKFWLFALDLPTALPPDSALTDDYQLIARQAVRSRQRYALRSHPEARAGLDEAPQRLREAMALPREGNPRTRAVAAGWREKHGGDGAAILAAAEDFFARQLLIYTLNPPLLDADAVDGFLFDSKRGFCEHFASSFVFALRAAGVPARVVAGYQGGEVNPLDGYLVVRQYDAHAWAEAWIAGRGWVRIDPTAISAPRRIDTNLANAVPQSDSLPLFARTDLSWLRDVRIRLDAWTNNWNQWVLGYSPQRQRDLLESLGMKSPDWQRMTAMLTALCGAILLLLTGLAVLQRQRVDPVRAQWLRFTRKLARRGVRWQPWEGPRDFATRAAQQLPERAAAIRAIAAAYAALRYGTASGETLADLRRQIASFPR